LCDARADRAGTRSVTASHSSVGMFDQLSIDNVDVPHEGTVFHSAIGQMQMA